MQLHALAKCASIFTFILATASASGTDTARASKHADRQVAPRNANNQTCLPELEDSFQRVWTLNKFLYQATQRAFANFPPNNIPFNDEFVPYNRTLEIELHNELGGFTTACAFDDPILDNATDKWWHCTSTEGPRALPNLPIETSIQLNRTTGGLLLNQTWYCNDTTDGGPPYRVATKGVLPDGPVRRLVCGSSTAVARNVICATNIAPIWCDVLFVAEWCSLGGDRDGRGWAFDFWATEAVLERLEEGWEGEVQYRR
ncbi:uncharacterized protein B0H64DRAFT_379148 [Chaetomium fimeti]|uniref:AA1-like domain-containing protein n=1 Tax=Chaetomium fimeti TaxID=1854472 RepID=A0AAE0HNF3_9PEZI|nr:hypothetical protein B0H64DRAFT_379148 [Chaetomium fimeti]